MSNVDATYLNLDSYARLSKIQAPKNEKVIVLEDFISKLMLPERKNLPETTNNNNNNLGKML